MILNFLYVLRRVVLTLVQRGWNYYYLNFTNEETQVQREVRCAQSRSHRDRAKVSTPE